MAKAHGPLFSIEARGTLANRLTYRRGRRSTTITTKPKKPATWSMAQVNHRSDIAALAAIYNGASDSDKASWDRLAIPRATTRWAEFTRENMRRMATGQTPTTVWPPEETAPPTPALTLTTIAHNATDIILAGYITDPQENMQISVLWNPDHQPVNPDDWITALGPDPPNAFTIDAPDLWTQTGPGYFHFQLQADGGATDIGEPIQSHLT